MNKNIEQIFKQNGGFLKAADLYAAGMTRREVATLLTSGFAVRVKKGYYQLANMDEPNESAMIVKLFPDAVLCMDTALFHYGYSDRTPLEWHLAVGRNVAKSQFDIQYPFVKPYYVGEKYFTIGIDTAYKDGIQMKIYDRERVICDCLRHKNKMDAEMFNKAIQSYVSDSKKSIKNLTIYSKQLRVYKKAQDLIGVWL